MAKTKAQVRNRALIKLGVLAKGQTAESIDADDMDDAYDQVYARLEQKGMVTWSSTDDIPDEFVEDVTALMAFERSENIPEARYIRIASDASRAFINISSLIQGEYENPREYTDY